MQINVSGNILPREKLIQFGPSALTNSELLAIIFVTGTRNENVLELSNRVIQDYGARSLSNLKNVIEIKNSWGLGETKASQLVAIFEIGRRIFELKSNTIKYIVSPEDIYELVKSQASLKQEQLKVLYVNQKQQLIKEEVVSLGNQNMNIVKPKEIVAPALDFDAHGIVMVHNHPSGDPFPSDSDIIFTEQIRKACDILEIELIDHIILGKDNYLSMREEKYF